VERDNYHDEHRREGARREGEGRGEEEERGDHAERKQE
jgi:hypothetical protein